MILAFNFGKEMSNGSVIGWEWLTAIIISNSILEAVVCTVLSPPLVAAVKKTCELTARNRHGAPVKKAPPKTEEPENIDEKEE